MNLRTRFRQSRWRWLLFGLPSVSRALALFRVKRNTMTTPERCKHLWDVCVSILKREVPGDFVECGVWRGGSAGVMGLALKRGRQQRRLHLFDSFEGLPEPTDADGKYAAEYSGGRSDGILRSVDQCRAGLEEVREFLFQNLDLDEALVQFHVGWFQNILPLDVPGMGPIALLRLDGDWYESTKVCLEHLYPLISSGGILILDDYYCWEGCAKATDEFRQAQGIRAAMHRIDDEAVYWEKE